MKNYYYCIMVLFYLSLSAMEHYNENLMPQKFLDTLRAMPPELQKQLIMEPEEEFNLKKLLLYDESKLLFNAPSLSLAQGTIQCACTTINKHLLSPWHTRVMSDPALKKLQEKIEPINPTRGFICFSNPIEQNQEPVVVQSCQFFPSEKVFGPNKEEWVIINNHLYNLKEFDDGILTSFLHQPRTPLKFRTNLSAAAYTKYPACLHPVDKRYALYYSTEYLCDIVYSPNSATETTVPYQLYGPDRTILGFGPHSYLINSIKEQHAYNGSYSFESYNIELFDYRKKEKHTIDLYTLLNNGTIIPSDTLKDIYRQEIKSYTNNINLYYEQLLMSIYSIDYNYFPTLGNYIVLSLKLGFQTKIKSFKSLFYHHILYNVITGQFLYVGFSNTRECYLINESIPAKLCHEGMYLNLSMSDEHEEYQTKCVNLLNFEPSKQFVNKKLQQLALTSLVYDWQETKDKKTGQELLNIFLALPATDRMVLLASDYGHIFKKLHDTIK